jgi:hypothetical protein
MRAINNTHCVLHSSRFGPRTTVQEGKVVYIAITTNYLALSYGCSSIVQLLTAFARAGANYRES